jgi:hypothetical protein
MRNNAPTAAGRHADNRGINMTMIPAEFRPAAAAKCEYAAIEA